MGWGISDFAGGGGSPCPPTLGETLAYFVEIGNVRTNGCTYGRESIGLRHSLETQNMQEMLILSIFLQFLNNMTS